MDRQAILARIDRIEKELAALRLEIEGGAGEINVMPAPPEPKAKTNRAHQLPSTWEPRPADIEWARASFPNVDITHETDSFRDYFAAAGRSYKDWHAAYRNWLRKAAQFSKARVPVLNGGPGQRAAALREGNSAKRDRALDKLAALQQAATALKV